ncbi:ATP-binding cassette domain-containing protein [Phaeovulum sp.]|uniref:branched-chain amino acid ABC transporter ATP-binding protein/permease n=1 Tax=Phaeovulum sp. TaxID=2934796 RepID=UPI0039E41A5C
MLGLRQFGKSAWVGSAMMALVFIIVAVLAETVLPASGARLATLFLIYVVAVLGNQIYSGNSGIMSFGHTSFMAIGAYASALLTIQPAIQATALPKLPGWIAALNGQPLVVALAGALVMVVIAAAIFGLPIARLGGSAASIATLGILVITHVTLVASTTITRGSQTFFGIPRGVPMWLVAGCAVAAVVAARLYRSSRSGLALRAAREDEIAAIAVGVNVVRLRFWSFVLGALLCGASGALLAHFLGAFSPKDFYFNLTFLLLSMLILGGISTVSGAVGGTAVIIILVQLLRRVESGGDFGIITLPPIFGLTDIGIGLVILLVMYRLREGLFGVRELDERLGLDDVPATAPEYVSAQTATAESLTVENVSKKFGGMTALEDVTFVIEPGLVTGLIGPNGAGKSTLINAVCGIVPPSSGRVMIGRQDVAALAVHEVSRAGLGRTFQNIRLFKNLTVLENVRVAANSVARPGEDSVAAARAALATVGLTDLAPRIASTLPYGAQRRLEIARALALRPHFLLLDEPAAGMNPTETDSLMDVLRHIRAEHQLGLLVVEHDLKLIMRLCDRIVVLNKGQQIAMGTPEEIRADPAVIEAYIGRKRAAQTSAQKPPVGQGLPAT